MDRWSSWAYFDGVAQDNPQFSGVGGTLYLRDTHCLKFKANIVR
jgi:hypothetical protein